jgi:hypothetical protein
LPNYRDELANHIWGSFGLRIQLLDWEFSIAAGAGDLFEGMAGGIGCQKWSADGVPFLKRAEGFSRGAECDQFRVSF